jgi:hypothetical protein
MIFVIPPIAIFILVLLYFWAYGVTGLRTTGLTEHRIYQHEWQGRIFTPAAKIESVIRQKTIEVSWLKESPFP